MFASERFRRQWLFVFLRIYRQHRQQIEVALNQIEPQAMKNFSAS